MAIGRFVPVVPSIGLFSLVIVVSILGAQSEPKNPLEVQACRDGAGGCVASTSCNVPTFRLRDDGCPSDLVCCPLPTITHGNLKIVSPAKNYQTTTEEPEHSDPDEETVTESIYDDVVSERQHQHSLAAAVHTRIQIPSSVASTYTRNGIESPDETERADSYMMPWMALIFSTHHCCNRALISSNGVLTINGCWEKCKGRATNWTVRLGRRYSTTTEKYIDQSVLNIRRSLRHIDEQSVREHHFALLLLEGAVEINQRIHPIGLPLATDAFNSETVNIMYTGRGSLTNQNNKTAIKTIQLEMFEKNQCQEEYVCVIPKDREDAAWLSRSKLGSPVVIELVTTSDSSRHYILLGLIAKKTGHTGRVMLSKVSHFQPWINSALQRTVGLSNVQLKHKLVDLNLSVVSR
ncbi:uncharacterized protein LOC125953318 [Anopheles darlingi]|uniref:uncharacterized protein LOC125953318 n=1 Tax=Anopheles darlingi TaxID=43151 RepID=UPI0020FFFC17|nr:uncharacterized protein LOC125953318 [Anopheles darlingi]